MLTKTACSTMKNRFSTKLFQSAPVVGILRGFSYDEIKRMMPAYINAGLRTIEVTMNSPQPVLTIKKLTEEFDGHLNVGAGTVCELEELKLAIEAGASFIVTPNINEAIIKNAVNNGVAIIPGAFTPTEIYNAVRLGATAIKLFPASCISPAFVKDVLGPFPNVKLIPTGGITLENIAAFIDAGAYGVGIGGHLFNRKIIQHANQEELYHHFCSFYNLLKSK